jgi:hypothetical protein
MSLAIQTTTTGKITTQGSCSPVVIQPKGGFQIICRDPRLTRAESERQAEQIAELLSRLRSSAQNNGEVIKKLDTIIAEIGEIKISASARHLSQVQKDAILKALAPYPGTSIQLEINMGDAESAGYVAEFVSLFRAARIKGVEGTGYGAGVMMPPVKGFLFRMNPGDLKENKYPPQCIALAKAISDSVLQGERPIATPDNQSQTGSCSLIVGIKDTDR